uniref:Receptor binding protein n=1 Tax=Gainesville rodent jeilong virus 1 TaxID=3163281 RepID=A0AAU7T2I2_9MONO
MATVLPTANYYGTSMKPAKREQEGDQSTCQCILGSVSMIVGLLSLFTIIALNVTNIISLTRSGGIMQDIRDSQRSIDGSVKDVYGAVVEEIKPKTDIINSMVGYTIPSQLTAIQNLIRNDVLRVCSPTFIFNNTLCPVAEDPAHSKFFKDLDVKAISSCTGQNRGVQVASDVEYRDYPSFIPGPTKPGGCVRIPSFSLSSTIFAYAHNIISRGCQDHSQSDQYFSIGRIADHGTEIPILETLTEWYINDGLNRKSCSVAAGETAAWMGCTIVVETERDDYKNPGIGKISLTYLDVYGRKKEWIYNQNEIAFDVEYAAMYFSVGSGVVIGDTVYFLVYGGLMTAMNVNAMCYAPGCSNPNQETCNNAQKPSYFYGRQIVNGVLSFKKDYSGKPSIKVTTISPSLIWMGAEGRLIYMPTNEKTYIYIRSQTWHALPQVGLIYFEDPIRIDWVEYTGISRPGSAPCGASSRCPTSCTTGVYTDIFPMGNNYDYGVTVYLATQNTRSNPQLAFVNTTSKIYQKVVTNTAQVAGYTTTTCFSFKMRVWCVSIVEMSPATVGSYEPIPFLYHLNLACMDYNTGVQGEITTRDFNYIVGDVGTPKTECMLEVIDGQAVLVIRVWGSNQSFKLVWNDSGTSSIALSEVDQLCHDVLGAIEDRGNLDLSTTEIATTDFTLRPIPTSTSTVYRTTSPTTYMRTYTSPTTITRSLTVNRTYTASTLTTEGGSSKTTWSVSDKTRQTRDTTNLDNQTTALLQPKNSTMTSPTSTTSKSNDTDSGSVRSSGLKKLE